MIEQPTGSSSAGLKQTLPRTSRAQFSTAAHNKGVIWIFVIGSLLAITLAVMQAYGNRAHIFQLDAICYLDLSDAVMHGDWKEVVNSHWSPVYPVELAITRTIFGTDTHFETAVLKIANFFNFLLTLVAFYWFLQAFLSYLKRTANRHFVLLPPSVVTLTLFICYAWCTLVLGGVYVDSPDQFAFATVIAATAIMLNAKTTKSALTSGVWLGIIFGLGYLSKAAVLPIALVYLGIILFSTDVPLKRRLHLIGCALIFFSLLASPWVYFISKKVGHLTFSDSSWFAYITYVQNTSHFIRIVLPDSLFTHPARMLTWRPPTLEFATPIGGTYPLWYDGIYWNQGVHAKLSARIFPIIFTNFLYYTVLLLPVAGAYVLQFVTSFPKFYPVRGALAAWKLWLPALAGLGMYTIVIPMIFIGESRYVAASVLLLFAAIIASLRIKNNSKGLVTLVTTLAVLILYPLSDILQEVGTDLTLVSTTPSYRHWHIAQALKELGIKPGSRVAMLGGEEIQAWYRCAPLSPRLTRVQQAWYYWARLAGLKVVAHVSPVITIDAVDEFLRCSDEDRAELYQKLSDLGVTAIVYNPCNDFDMLESGARSQPSDFIPGYSKPITMPAGWRELAGMHAYGYILPHPKKIEEKPQAEVIY